MALHLPAQTLHLARCLMLLNLLTKGFLVLVCNDIQTPICFFLQISSSAHHLPAAFVVSPRAHAGAASAMKVNLHLHPLPFFFFKKEYANDVYYWASVV